MIEQTLATIAEAVAGRVYPNDAGDIKVQGVQFDSRQIESGHLFVPLVAERDGHDFTSSAIEKGQSLRFGARMQPMCRQECPLY